MKQQEMLTLMLTDAKFYVPVFTLSTEDDNKLLEQLKTGFKRTADHKCLNRLKLTI